MNYFHKKTKLTVLNLNFSQKPQNSEKNKKIKIK